MIVVCEPISRGASHEKVNSGFLTALRLAYPHERIAFYAHRSHVAAIRTILEYDGVGLDRIDFIPQRLPLPYRALSVLRYTGPVWTLLQRAASSDTRLCIFLGFSADSLWVLKRLKKLRRFAEVRCVLVLHGEFERIDPGFAPVLRSHSVTIPLRDRARKYWDQGFGALVTKTGAFLYDRLRRALGWQNGTQRWFDYSSVLHDDNSTDYRYLALSPHIVRNAKELRVGAEIDVRNIRFPMNFAPARPLPRNRFPRFAMLGGGATQVLFEVLTLLYRKNPSRPFEVRLLSADSSLVGVFPAVTHPTGGRFLARSEIESHLADVDVLLILYRGDEYRLSCSNNVFEAISYRKPVVHLSNESVDTVNTVEAPIGYRCTSVADYADVLYHVIERYEEFLSEREKFIENIELLRERFHVHQTGCDLRRELHWDGPHQAIESGVEASQSAERRFLRQW